MEKFCAPLNWTVDWGHQQGLPRCLHAVIFANILFVAALYLQVKLCFFKSKYNCIAEKNSQRVKLTTALAILVAIFKLVSLSTLLLRVYESFVPWLFLPHFVCIKGWISVVLINLRTRKFVHNDVAFFVVLNWLCGLSALLGLGNEEWFFEKEDGFIWPADRIEFNLWLIEIILSSLLLLVTLGPNLEIKILPTDDGRLYVPLESDSRFRQFFYRLRYMWAFTWPKSLFGRSSLVVCFALMIFTRVTLVFLPLFAKKVVDQLSELQTEETFHEIAINVGTIVILKVLTGNNGFFAQIKDILYVHVEQESERNIQITLFEHLHQLPYEWHIKRKTGDILKNVERGSSAVMNLLDWIFFKIGPTLLDVVIAIIFFGVAFDWRFSLIVLITAVIYIVSTIGITEWRTKYRRKMIAMSNSQNSRAIDSLLNFEQVKLNCNEKHETALYEEKIKNYQKEERKVTYSLTVLNTVQNLLNNIGFALGSLIAVKSVLDGKDTVGDYVLFGTYMAQLYTPLNFLGTYYRIIQAAITDTEKLMDLLAERPEPKEPEDPAKLKEEPLELSLENVTFRYGEDEREILSSISLTVPPGETWAIVGTTGGGKSTIARILLGLVEPSEGAVKVGGWRISQLGRKQVRKFIGTVSQDITLFNDTIEENVKYSRLAASEDEIREAVQVANLDPGKWKNGLKSEVGERGLALSGGEKQRVAIARLLLKAPKAVILDEATSALDTVTEKQIHRELVKAVEGVTCLMIAHRLSTVVHSHRILVIEEGRVLEQGTHTELIALGGSYCSLWQQQSEYTQEDSSKHK